ncbi:F-box protein CPR1-like [Argentina anserina]|uniref:F-box protein CPR1-like n=1 Tax=Argentina anserina TaxID=57926 RepID=UPI0021768DF2|nr:F-box protein CPR1-like [Potentilla anserina]
MANELPHDIIENNILTRLPVKSLIRFTSVSQRWRSLILYCPKFAASQFEFSSKQKSIAHRVLVSCNGYDDLQSLDLGSSSSPTLRLPFKQQQVHCNLIGSSNGLVFVALGNKYYVWNPSTRFFKTLPDIDYCSGRRVFFGAGYSSASGTYKLLICREDDDEEIYTEVAHILSLGAPKWRLVNLDVLNEMLTGPVFMGTLLNGALHWLCGYSKYDLVAFDLAKEEFRIMQLLNLDDDGSRFYRGKLGVLGGCLCVSSYTEYNYACVSVDFWVMKDYDVRESWTKLFNLDMSNLPLQPLLDNTFRLPWTWYTMECGTVGVKWSGEGRNVLMKIDHDEKEKHGLYLIEGWELDMVDYEESLIWIEEKENVKKTKITKSSSRSRKKLKS